MDKIWTGLVLCQGINEGLGCTQSQISKQFRGKTLGWTTFRQIFHFLYRDNIGDGIFSPDDIQHTDLREWARVAAHRSAESVRATTLKPWVGRI